MPQNSLSRQVAVWLFLHIALSIVLTAMFPTPISWVWYVIVGFWWSMFYWMRNRSFLLAVGVLIAGLASVTVNLAHKTPTWHTIGFMLASMAPFGIGCLAYWVSDISNADGEEEPDDVPGAQIADDRH